MKTIVITGGNSGLGLETARLLAQDLNNQLILACRDQAKAQTVVKALRAETGNDAIQSMALDLASFASIRGFVAELLQRVTTVDVLACNAGLQLAHGTQLTADGYEMSFGVNYVGHFLLTSLLMPHINPHSGRIVLVSSGTHFKPAIWQGKIFGIPPGEYVGWQALASPTSMQHYPERSRGYARYSASKLCVLYFGYELNRRLRQQGSGISVNLYDPGLMPGTELARAGTPIEQWAWQHVMPVLRLFDGVFTVQTSARNFARLLVDPSMQGVTGQYYEGPKRKPSSADSYNQANWADLWMGGEELTQAEFSLCSVSV